MKPVLLPAAIIGCLIGLVLTCFGPVLFQDQQFSYRDAGNFYYPLYERVQQEWEAGRWPLWEPEENGGVPLLGNPAAAVLYPGKVLYALPLPYAWGARLYVIAHVLLAFGAMLALLRSWRVSWTGSSLGAMAYAFGSPVLFQYCNVIFLVGAAWAPLGLRAVDGLVRLGRRWSVVELASVLAMQILGGDPQAAYLVVLCGGLYALGLDGGRGGASPRAEGRPRPGRGKALRVGLSLVLAVGAWVGGTLAAAAWSKARKGGLVDAIPLPYRPPYQVALLVGWGLAATLLWIGWRNRPEGRGRLRSLAGLGGASALALGLSAAQLLPVLEFSRLSVRADEGGRHDLYHFSLEPCRVVEWLWPGFFGMNLRGNHNWLALVPPAHGTSLWVPSCYLGGLTLLLALGALGFRGGPPWRGWLSAIALVSLLGALGKFGSPIWWARFLPGMDATIGPHDPTIFGAPRIDGGLSDGDGGFYWLMASILPFFRTFRYPAKLLTFTSLALAALAGIGWDRSGEGRAASGRRLPLVLLVLSLGALVAVSASRDRILQLFDPVSQRRLATYLGPFDPQGALADLRRALGQGATVMALGVVLAFGARRRSPWAGPVALAVLAADLALADAPLVVTVPQALFDRKPRVLRLIEEAEKRDPSPGPFRVHRMFSWNPPGWHKAGADDRPRQVARWEHETVYLKHAIPFHYSYTLSRSPLEVADYWYFFSGFPLVLDAGRAGLPGATDGQRIAYQPRRAYDLWTTRYFILPLNPDGWADNRRGFASFLDETELIAPDGRLFEDPANLGQAREWLEAEDWQLRRNQAASPRAWVVHQARRVDPIGGPGDRSRGQPLQEILFGNDRFWFDAHRPVFDPHALAWIEVDDITPLAPYLPGTRPDPSEGVTITRYEPQRVELEARLNRPGLVILADAYYPGWALTIDGEPATILRANHLMRGAPVGAGTHRLVYIFEPLSFRLGGWISLASLALGLLLLVGTRGRPTGPSTRRPEAPEPTGCTTASPGGRPRPPG